MSEMIQKEESILNRVAASDLVTLNLEEYIPKGERVLYDLADNLYEGFILREKPFRAFLKEHNWSGYKGKHVALLCSVDAIVPKWAFMLLVSKISLFAETVVFGDLNDLERELFRSMINEINPEDYRDKKVVIKGCGDKKVPDSAFIDIIKKLQPSVASIMYGEPCSTVPIYKRPKIR